MVVDETVPDFSARRCAFLGFFASFSARFSAFRRFLSAFSSERVGWEGSSSAASRFRFLLSLSFDLDFDLDFALAELSSSSSSAVPAAVPAAAAAAAAAFRSALRLFRFSRGCWESVVAASSSSSLRPLPVQPPQQSLERPERQRLGRLAPLGAEP